MLQKEYLGCSVETLRKCEDCEEYNWYLMYHKGMEISNISKESAMDLLDRLVEKYPNVPFRIVEHISYIKNYPEFEVRKNFPLA